jgi:hypothetical protein
MQVGEFLRLGLLAFSYGRLDRWYLHGEMMDIGSTIGSRSAHGLYLYLHMHVHGVWTSRHDLVDIPPFPFYIKHSADMVLVE